MSLTEEERAQFLTLETGQVSDAMEMLNLRRSVLTGFMLLGPANAKIVGTAVTVRQGAKGSDDAAATPAMRHREVSDRIAGRGDVVVVDVGGRVDVASWGEFHCYRCMRNGVAGAIINGSTRDAPEIRASGFPLMCKGLSPIKSRWDLKTASVNEPITIGAVEIIPGDIIFADETGVIVIAKSRKADVLAKALQIAAEEGELKKTFGIAVS